MKTVHWQVPFCSQDGTHYRIDIYASGDATPEVLIGGDNVFTTNEDDSTDYFCPVRTQTGTLRLVDTDGTLLERIVPDNNLDHPIKLVNVDTGEVEWQGFLGCEAYSQTYTARTQILSLSVISVLEAMKSVELDNTAAKTLNIHTLLFYAIHKVETEGDLDMLDDFYFPFDCFNFLSCYLDASCMFSQKDVFNENVVRFEVYSISCFEVLSRICTFMGLTARESGASLYIIKSSGSRFVKMRFIDLYSRISSDTNMLKNIVYMYNFQYRGDDHKKSINQGAKSVEVISKVDQYNMSASIPACPVGFLAENHVLLNKVRLYSLTNTNDHVNSLISFLYVGGRYKTTKALVTGTAAYRIASIQAGFSGGIYPSVPLSNSILSLGLQSALPTQWADADLNVGGEYTWNTTEVNCTTPLFAALAKCEFYEGDEKNAHNTEDGLFLSGLNVSPINGCTVTTDDLTNYALVTILSATSLTAKDGWFNIQISAKFISAKGVVGYSKDTNTLRFCLKFSNLYWNGSIWSSNFATFTIPIKDGTVKTNKTDDINTQEEDGWFIPVLPVTTGKIELRLYHEIEGEVKDNDSWHSNAFYAFITQLNVRYIPYYTNKFSDRTENHYYRILGINFRDEIQINSSIASDMNNHRSPNVLQVDTINTMSDLVYQYEDGEKSIRPEIEMLGRMEQYYKENRRSLELEIKPEQKNFLMNYVSGYDGRTYIPAAISREWQEDKATVMLMEMPESPK